MMGTSSARAGRPTRSAAVTGEALTVTEPAASRPNAFIPNPPLPPPLPKKPMPRPKDFPDWGALTAQARRGVDANPDGAAAS